MTRFLHLTLMTVAVSAAFLCSLPGAVSGTFGVTGGGDPCTHEPRANGHCPSIGSGTCNTVQKICGGAGDDNICTDGTGGAVTGCGGANQICGAANHATADSNCK